MYHIIITWLVLDICNIKFLYILSLLSGIITLIPIITPYIILIPSNILNLIYNEFSFMNILILNIAYYILITSIDNCVYKRNVRKSDPYITGLSFVMGMYTFGLKGIIYGPVILCFSITVTDIIKILIK
jgi:predicted PurR-regulated permease PerM